MTEASSEAAACRMLLDGRVDGWVGTRAARATGCNPGRFKVRNLAGRAADAAKEIKSLIGMSVEKVEAGLRQVDAAGVSMDGIVNQVRRVTELISEIATATDEQSRGISQVGDAVAQLDQVTQQNAALVEESAAAADSLQQQAVKLAEVVSVFKLVGGGSALGSVKAG